MSRATPPRSPAISGTSRGRAIAWSGCSRWTCSRIRPTSRPWPDWNEPGREVLPAAALVAGRSRSLRRLRRGLSHPASHGRSCRAPPPARCDRRGHRPLPQGHGLRRSRGRPVPALPEGSVARRLRRVLAPRGARHDARARAAARDLPARGSGPAPGAVPGHPCRHPVRRQAQQPHRLRLDGGCPDRPGHAHLLARHHADPRLLGPAQLAALLRARRSRASHPARRHPRPLHHGAHHAAHTLGHARGDGAGLYPHGAGQGGLRAAGGLEARPQERFYPHHHHRGHRAGHAPRRLRDNRDDLRVAWSRAAVRAGDLQPRLSRGAGRRLSPRQHLRVPELHRGRGLHLARSAHPVPLMAPPNGASSVVLPLPSAPEERQWVMTLKRLARRRTALFGLAVVAVVILSAVGAPLVTVFDPIEQDINQRLREPGWRNAAGQAHLLGTDHLGRDILARIIYGSRVALVVGLSAVLISGVLGMAIGLVSGYFGGKVDDFFMRLADIQLAFPFILLAIAVIGVLGPSLRNIIVVIGVSSWVVYARVVRGEVLSIRERAFVQAAIALGSRDGRVLVRHVLPNAFTPWLVVATLDMARVIVIESALSFLGLGVQPPTPTWGGMLADGRVYLSTAWWLATFPGLAILVTVLGINLLGDGLRDTLDPRLKV